MEHQTASNERGNQVKAVTYNVAKEYAEDLGARHVDDGDYSGEHFLQEHLLKMVEQAITDNYVLCLNFDGVTGLPTSFASEAFGGLRREHPEWTASLLEQHVQIEAPMTPKLWPYIVFARHALKSGIAETKKS